MSTHWSDPGAEMVAPGVHRLPLPLPGDGLRAVNVYAIEDGDRIALVDAGWHREDAWDELGRGLAQFGAEVGDVSTVLVTHVHHDHYGQAPRLREASGAVVVLGEHERRSIVAIMDPEARVDAQLQGARLLRRNGAGELADELRRADMTRDGAPIGDTGRWELPDVFVADGRTIELSDRELEVVHTPGHTRGHVSFMDRAAGGLYAGDHVLPHITPSLGVEPFNDGLALGRYLTALARVRALPVSTVFPAHGPVFDDLAGRVDELLEHHEVRLRACEAAVRGGAHDGFAVAHVLRWTRRERHYDELDLFNRMLAVNETVAHLELLAAQGALTRSADEERVAYHLARPAPAPPETSPAAQ